MEAEWKQFRFEELCDITRGASPRPIHDWIATHGIPWIKISDATATSGTTILETKEFIKPAGKSRSVAVHPGDLILSNSATPGMPKFLGIEACIHDGWLLLRNFRNLDKQFAYYLLLRDRDALVGQGNGSVFTNLKTEILKRHSVVIPPLADQSRIAHILGTLDDKIELNRRMATTLEEMARATFKSWFIDFDPVRSKAEGRPTNLPPEIDALFPDSLNEDGIPGWELTTLSSITTEAIGGDWGKDEQSSEYCSEALCIRGADIPGLQAGGFGKMPTRFLKASSILKRSLADGDIVLEISGGSPTQSTGRVVHISSQLLSRRELPLVCSNFCRLVRPSSTNLSGFIYYWMRHLYDLDELYQYETGTTGIKNFAFKHFSESRQFPLPPSALLDQFDATCKKIMAKQMTLAAENEILAAIRDALLPKLISGVIRVGQDQSDEGE